MTARHAYFFSRRIFALLVFSSLFGCLGVFAFAGMNPVSAQTKTGGDDVVISGNRINPDEGRGPTGARTTVKVSENRGPGDTLPDLLEREASVRVNRFGGRGAFAGVSVRGSNPNQVNFFIDGIPLSNPVTGEINLADMNLDGLDKIEIYRSGDFGGSSLGGSVNMITRKAGRGAGLSIKALGGSYKTFGLGVNTYGGDALRYNVTVGAETSDQDFIFRNDNGTPLLNTLDDFDDERKNSWYRNFSATTTLGFKYGDTRLFALNDTIYRNHGIPGPAPVQSEKTERHALRSTTGFGSDTPAFFSRRLRLQTRFFYSELRERFHDPRQEFSSNQPHSRSRLRNYGMYLLPTLFLHEWHQTLKLFIGLTRDDFRDERRDRFDERVERVPLKLRNETIVRLEDEISFLDERILIIPSVDYRRYLDRFNEDNRLDLGRDLFADNKTLRESTTYRLGSRFIVYEAKGSEIALRAGGSTGRRVPLFVELFGERGSIIGNGDLRPEKARSLEAGVEGRTVLPALPFIGSGVLARTRLTVFNRIVEDMILFVPNSQFTLRPENIDAARIQGLEAMVSLRVKRRWKIALNYTYQRAVNESDVDFLEGNYLPLRPRHELNTGASMRTGPLRFGFEAIFVGAVFRDRSNEPTGYVPARWLYNLHARWTVLKAAIAQTRNLKKNPLKIGERRELQLGVQVKNLQNRRVTDTTGFPLPGRRVFFTAEYKF